MMGNNFSHFSYFLLTLTTHLIKIRQHNFNTYFQKPTLKYSFILKYHILQTNTYEINS